MKGGNEAFHLNQNHPREDFKKIEDVRENEVKGLYREVEQQEIPSE